MPERKEYGQAIIEALSQEQPSEAMTHAIDWLRANLTEAARYGCHHCGEGDRPDGPCWWCGLRDKPRRIRKASSGER